ncbi:MAG: DsbA family protein, partial [Candidatus Micrarchaeales archaeon]
EKRATKKNNEPVMIVRPAVKSLGLDYLHVSLIVLVIILAALAFSLSSFKGATVLSCQYGTSSSGSCATPTQTSANVLAATEQILAGYSVINSSLSLLPYYSIPNQARISYLSNQSEWIVVVPYILPYDKNQTFYTSFLLYDSNLTLAQPFLSSIKPLFSSQNKAVALGAVNIFGKTACATTPGQTIPIYAFIDPYAPGALQGMLSGINASILFGNKVNVSYKFLFTSYATRFYSSYGINQTQQNGEDLWCASMQSSKFASYLKNYTILFTGNPIQNTTLIQIAQGSGLNMTEFNSCLAIAPAKLDAQIAFAGYYGISATPSYVVNCKYQTIPQTLNYAINYTINQTKG